MKQSIIDVFDYTPKDSGFECLRPRRQIIIQIDKKFKVSVLILDFDNCPIKFVCLQPHNSVQKDQFLGLDRTPLSSPEVLYSNDSGYGSDYNIVFSGETKWNLIVAIIFSILQKNYLNQQLVFWTPLQICIFNVVAFFMTSQEFKSRLNFISFHYWKIEIFCKFVKNNIGIVIKYGFYLWLC